MIINFLNLLTLLFHLYIKLSIYYMLIKARHVKINQKFYLVFNAILLLISRSYYLFRYWTEFEIRCRKSEKFWKASEFCRNADRVSGRFKWKSCRCIFERMYIRASKRGFGNESSRLYIVDISLLHEIFNGNRARWQWIFDAGRNAV